MEGLTPKQQQVLSYIQKFITQEGYSPSYREIMKEFSFSSTGSVYNYIKILKRKEALSSEKKCSRSLRPLETTVRSSPHNIDLPFIGYIEAGTPIATFPQNQTISIPSFLIHDPEQTYALQVRGESFQDELLEDGDLLLIEARSEAQAGETVVALVNQHDTIVQLYYPEGEYVKLKGKNPLHQPLILRHQDLIIQGILIGMIRAY